MSNAQSTLPLLVTAPAPALARDGDGGLATTTATASRNQVETSTSFAHHIRSGLRVTDREALNLLYNLAVFLIFYMLGIFLVLQFVQINDA